MQIGGTVGLDLPAVVQAFSGMDTAISQQWQ